MSSSRSREQASSCITSYSHKGRKKTSTSRSSERAEARQASKRAQASYCCNSTPTHLTPQRGVRIVCHHAHPGTAGIVGPASLVGVGGRPHRRLQRFHPRFPVRALVVVLVRSRLLVLGSQGSDRNDTVRPQAKR